MKNLLLLLFLGIISYTPLSTQESNDDKDPMQASHLSGMKFRSIGPAFASGRIADIAIHPDDDNVWYVAVASGGIWKTNNAGITWTPLFDGQSVYSIGCITIDPSNPSVIWAGTGENVGGRHISFGDGIYKSSDGGKSWNNMGLKESQHISKIIIHPDNSDKITVAVQGPLWNSGGERGLYTSEDGGTTWTKTLGDNTWTGVTDIVVDPRNPDLMYAATWQRHRTVAAYMGGGPETAIHKSTDGGQSWNRLSGGLPGGDMGKIGLAISPQNPDVVYAAIELTNRKGGVYRTADQGATWKKMSDAVSGGTGPHYYQELYASPHAFDRIYLMDVRIQVSDDGGKNFRRLNEQHKHSDNHAMAFRSDDPDYLLIGSDGGIYESFDLAQNWRFMDNLPITQYYKVAVDDAEPFYNVFGGTQDVNTHGGPSRTDNVHGIRNGDWYITLFGDGHQPATEPGNPDIIYSEWQQGNLCRIDQTTGEIVYIKPQPAAGDPHERYNWDAPILVSPHKPTRLYFASQRVWKSEDRGDSWTAISGDLTKNENRITLPIMGKQWSYDAAWDIYAMSNYNTITSLSESPQKEGLVYAGTDDGILQVTEDGGTTWRKIEVRNMPGVPATAFINDVKADMHDASTVYVALDNHKYGDFKPYLMKSTDKGRSWSAIKNGLPEKTLVWRIVQDHVDKDLMFLGTEFGIYCTLDGGDKWIQMKGGLPTISFRDLAIQKRENDLVAASFGRGFYILDDYSALRQMDNTNMTAEASLYGGRKAWWYMERPGVGFGGKGNQGADYYVADNPPFGAVITYHVNGEYKSTADLRKEKEKELKKNKQNIPFPGYDAIDAENDEVPVQFWVTISDQSGNLLKRIKAPHSKGTHRVVWDLTTMSKEPLKLDGRISTDASGYMVAPGTYEASLYKEENGTMSMLSGPVNVEIERMREGALPGSSPDQTVDFWAQLEDVNVDLSKAYMMLSDQKKKVDNMMKALQLSPKLDQTVGSDLIKIKKELTTIDRTLNGSPARNQIGEKNAPTISERIGFITLGVTNATYGPNPSHKNSMDIVKAELDPIISQLKSIDSQLNKSGTTMKQMGLNIVE